MNFFWILFKIQWKALIEYQTGEQHNLFFYFKMITLLYESCWLCRKLIMLLHWRGVRVELGKKWEGHYKCPGGNKGVWSCGAVGEDARRSGDGFQRYFRSMTTGIPRVALRLHIVYKREGLKTVEWIEVFWFKMKNIRSGGLGSKSRVSFWIY